MRLHPVIYLGLDDSRGGPRPLVCAFRHHLPMWEPTPISVRVKSSLCRGDHTSPASFSRSANPSLFQQEANLLLSRSKHPLTDG